MRKVNWTVIVIVGIIVVVLLAFIPALLGSWGFGGYGYRGFGMMGPGMMGGGMFFTWLIPLAFLLLAVLGIVWLVRTFGGGTHPANLAPVCPNCGRSVQDDWKHCPHCGQVLVR